MSTVESTETIERKVVLIDGFVVDAESGEVYGLAQDADVRYDALADEYTHNPSAPVDFPFRVTDADSADWVLGLRMEAEAHIKTIEAMRSAMNANFDRMAQPHRNRLSYLEYRFGWELEAYAAANLPKGRKSLALPHGSINFRTVAATFKIVDPDAAVKWAEAYAPSIIEKSVGKTAVAKLVNLDELPPFAEPVPERQSCTIKTGI